MSRTKKVTAPQIEDYIKQSDPRPVTVGELSSVFGCVHETTRARLRELREAGSPVLPTASGYCWAGEVATKKKAIEIIRAGDWMRNSIGAISDIYHNAKHPFMLSGNRLNLPELKKQALEHARLADRLGRMVIAVNEKFRLTAGNE